MVEYLNELRAILKKLDGILLRLEEFEKQKTNILTKEGTNELNVMINQEQALVMELTTAEKIRDKICRRMGHSTLREFIETRPEHAEEFTVIYNSLNDKLVSIKRSSELNAKLLQTKIGIIESIKSQFGIVDESNTYTKPTSAGAEMNGVSNTYTKPTSTGANANRVKNKVADAYGKNR